MEDDSIESGIGCVIRAAPSLGFRGFNDIKVLEVKVSGDWYPTLDENEDLVSNIVQIESSITEKVYNY